MSVYSNDGIELSHGQMLDHLVGVHSFDLSKIPFDLAVKKSSRRCVFCQNYRGRTKTIRVDKAYALYCKMKRVTNEYYSYINEVLNRDELLALSRRTDP